MMSRSSRSASVALLLSIFAPSIDAARIAQANAVSSNATAETGKSLLEPLGVTRPNQKVWTPSSGHYWKPSRFDTQGPFATNKFWTNWAGDKASTKIYPNPYTVKWAKLEKGTALEVSHSKPKATAGSEKNVGKDRAIYYSAPYFPEFTLGAKESADPTGPRLVHEGLMGVHAQLTGLEDSKQKLTYPIFSGMAYVSAKYEGGFTPQITTPAWSWGYQIQIRSIKKVQNGVFEMVTSHSNLEIRAYVLDASGKFVDGSYMFDKEGLLNKPLDGWVRMAHVLSPKDRDVLDKHAQAVVVGIELSAEENGVVQYRFEKVGPSKVLHYGYVTHAQIMDLRAPGAPKPAGIAASWTPTKGNMSAYVGDTWTLQADVSKTSKLGFLPGGKVKASYLPKLKAETASAIEKLHTNNHAFRAMNGDGYYSSGKIFQKVASLCLLSEELTGAKSEQTQGCVKLLARGFRCYYSPKATCKGTQVGLYDEDWGGVVNKKGYGDKSGVAADFGNACYNDHHYHYGYFVVSAAVLVKLDPAHAKRPLFMDFVHTLIRDTANPSAKDKFFPRFRAFDWFELHSWSHGVMPSADGKDEESTSEDINLYYGMTLFGQVTGNSALKQIGSTMLSLMATSIPQFFLMENDNQNHPPSFVKNHVTGVFLQNKVHYTTWFSSEPRHIHGIQMMPLSPALQLVRRPSFCKQEWEDIVSKLPLEATDSWTSVLISGDLAIIKPDEAYKRLSKLTKFDAGLSRAWAMYWAASQPGL